MSRQAVVLALVTGAFGGCGGVAAVSRDIVRAFGKLDNVRRVVVHPLLGANAIEALPPKVEQQSGGMSKLAYVRAALRAAQAYRPCLVYCDHLHIAPVAALAARVARARLFVHVHGHEIWSEPSLLRRLALESADLVLCVSRDTRARVLSFLDLPPERVAVLNNTFDIETAGDWGAVPRARTYPALSSTLLTVGRMSSSEQYKGHEHVFDALAVLRARGVDVNYVIVGDGDDRARLEARAKEVGVAEHVHFLGPVSRSELVHLYRTASAFVMPSSGEGFGIAFVEAMAMGTPAVGLAASGAKDALADGVVGVATDVEGLPAAILQAINLSEEEREAGAARTYVRFGRERYDATIAKMMSRYVFARNEASAPAGYAR